MYSFNELSEKHNLTAEEKRPPNKFLVCLTVRTKKQQSRCFTSAAT